MSAKTSIEWTATVHPDGSVTPGKTWNPVTGCSKVSLGCKHCYAETIAKRLWPSTYPLVVDHVEDDIPIKRHRQFTDVQCHQDRLLQPLSWRKPARVFVNSMSDLFHEDVPDAFIADVFGVMKAAWRHTFQILTKRPRRMRQLVDDPMFQQLAMAAANQHRAIGNFDWPIENVWLGVSVENQHFADARIPVLRQTPASTRFISAEPLLGPVDVQAYLTGHEEHGIDLSRPVGSRVGCCVAWTPPLDWVIVGGESGLGARPMHAEWADRIREQCRADGVPFFLKQYGSNLRVGYYNREWRDWYEARGLDWPDPIAWDIDHDGQPPLDSVVHLALKDRKGGDPAEWPADLRVREFPGVRA